LNLEIEQKKKRIIKKRAELTCAGPKPLAGPPHFLFARPTFPCVRTFTPHIRRYRWRVGPTRQGRFFPVNLARVTLSSPQWPISSPWNPRPLGLNPRGATLPTLAHLLGISPGPFHRQPPSAVNPRRCSPPLYSPLIYHPWGVHVHPGVRRSRSSGRACSWSSWMRRIARWGLTCRSRATHLRGLGVLRQQRRAAAHLGFSRLVGCVSSRTREAGVLWCRELVVVAQSHTRLRSSSWSGTTPSQTAKDW
jgi:hypothetical protein